MGSSDVALTLVGTSNFGRLFPGMKVKQQEKGCKSDIKQQEKGCKVIDTLHHIILGRH